MSELDVDPPELVQVPFTSTDWMRVHERVELIMRSHTKGAGKRDRNFRVDTDRDDTAVHLAGVVGEEAFGKWSGLPLPEIRARGGDGNGPDFWFNRYEGINVKCVAPERNLVPRKGLPLLAHYYGLVWWGGREADLVQLVGWIDRPTMLAERHIRDFKIGPQLYFPWKRMFSFHLLDAHIGGWK